MDIKFDKLSIILFWLDNLPLNSISILFKMCLSSSETFVLNFSFYLDKLAIALSDFALYSLNIRFLSVFWLDNFKERLKLLSSNFLIIFF